MTTHRVVEGYLLLPFDKSISYRGVNRQPFEPAILPAEINSQVDFSKHMSSIWILYPAGWRQEAYRLYEENSNIVDDLYLISKFEVAKKIQQIITPHVSLHEIVKCKVWDSRTIRQLDLGVEESFLGYDVAYPGGDYYSAIFNGLVVNPHPVLVREYGHLLNNFGLFSKARTIMPYLARFRELVPSEINSKFSIFYLILADT